MIGLRTSDSPSNQQYLTFCKAIGIVPPMWLFCTLVDVQDATFYSEWGSEGHAIDRPVVELPEMEVAHLDINVDTRPSTLIGLHLERDGV